MDEGFPSSNRADCKLVRIQKGWYERSKVEGRWKFKGNCLIEDTKLNTMSCRSSLPMSIYLS